jgi:hypothetical protein
MTGSSANLPRNLLVLGFTLLSLTGCAAMRPGGIVREPTRDWRQVVTADDRQRLRDWRGTWVKALQHAQARGYSAQVASEGALLQPDAAVAGPAIPNGTYRCRTLKLGARSEGLLPFVAYAAGMGLVIGVTAVAVALADHSLVRRLRRASAVAPRLGGAVLIVTGAYVAWYGGYELRVNADRRVSGTDPIVNAAARVQEGAAALVSGVGAGWLLAALTTLTVVAVVIHRRRFVRVGRI